MSENNSVKMWKRDIACVTFPKVVVEGIWNDNMSFATELLH